MDIKKYIESGVLELYVAGTLTEEENKQVFSNIEKHPKLLEEVKKIESSVSALTSAVAPDDSEYSFKRLLMKMIQETDKKGKVVPLESKPTNWINYTGWVASLLIGSFLIYSVINSNQVQEELDVALNQKGRLENVLAQTRVELNSKEKILTNIRDKEVITVPLQGQKISPSSYAKVYWNKDRSVMYVDVQGLPEPPKGKVYQLWSLKLSPLTPTSLGTLSGFATNTNKIFEVTNTNDSQAFGITLEPEGGSKSPTLEQLYTLGALSS